MQIPLTFETTSNVFIKMKILQINIQFKARIYSDVCIHLCVPSYITNIISDVKSRS